MWSWHYNIILFGTVSTLLALAQADTSFLAPKIKITPSNDSKAKVCFRTADEVDVSSIDSAGYTSRFIGSQSRGLDSPEEIGFKDTGANQAIKGKLLILLDDGDMNSLQSHTNRQNGKRDNRYNKTNYDGQPQDMVSNSPSGNVSGGSEEANESTNNLEGKSGVNSQNRSDDQNDQSNTRRSNDDKTRLRLETGSLGNNGLEQQLYPQLSQGPNPQDLSLNGMSQSSIRSLQSPQLRQVPTGPNPLHNKRPPNGPNDGLLEGSSFNQYSSLLAIPSNSPVQGLHEYLPRYTSPSNNQPSYSSFTANQNMNPNGWSSSLLGNNPQQQQLYPQLFQGPNPQDSSSNGMSQSSINNFQISSGAGSQNINADLRLVPSGPSPDPNSQPLTGTNYGLLQGSTFNQYPSGSNNQPSYSSFTANQNMNPNSWSSSLLGNNPQQQQLYPQLSQGPNPQDSSSNGMSQSSINNFQISSGAGSQNINADLRLVPSGPSPDPNSQPLTGTNYGLLQGSTFNQYPSGSNNQPSYSSFTANQNMNPNGWSSSLLGNNPQQQQLYPQLSQGPNPQDSSSNGMPQSSNNNFRISSGAGSQNINADLRLVPSGPNPGHNGLPPTGTNYGLLQGSTFNQYPSGSNNQPSYSSFTANQNMNPNSWSSSLLGNNPQQQQLYPQLSQGPNPQDSSSNGMSQSSINNFQISSGAGSQNINADLRLVPSGPSPDPNSQPLTGTNYGLLQGSTFNQYPSGSNNQPSYSSFTANQNMNPNGWSSSLLGNNPQQQQLYPQLSHGPNPQDSSSNGMSQSSINNFQISSGAGSQTINSQLHDVPSGPNPGQNGLPPLPNSFQSSSGSGSQNINADLRLVPSGPNPDPNSLPLTGSNNGLLQGGSSLNQFSGRQSTSNFPIQGGSPVYLPSYSSFSTNQNMNPNGWSSSLLGNNPQQQQMPPRMFQGRTPQDSSSNGMSQSSINNFQISSGAGSQTINSQLHDVPSGPNPGQNGLPPLPNSFQSSSGSGSQNINADLRLVPSGPSPDPNSLPPTGTNNGLLQGSSLNQYTSPYSSNIFPGRGGSLGSLSSGQQFFKSDILQDDHFLAGKTVGNFNGHLNVDQNGNVSWIVDSVIPNPRSGPCSTNQKFVQANKHSSGEQQCGYYHKKSMIGSPPCKRMKTRMMCRKNFCC